MDTNESTPFDDVKLGILTRHGIAPARGPTSMSKAKINQDRGVICWPFNGSHDQALLAVFDGHGLQGERISEWCAGNITVRLEAASALLAQDPDKCISKTVAPLAERCAAVAPLLPPLLPPQRPQTLPSCLRHRPLFAIDPSGSMDSLHARVHAPRPFLG